MDNQRGVAEERALSSTALAREISALVSRALGGEAIDIAAQGHALAAKYPELNMSGELIGKAIVRASEMMQAMRNGNDPAPAAAATNSASDSHGAVNGAQPPPVDKNGDAQSSVQEPQRGAEKTGQARDAAPPHMNGYSAPETPGRKPRGLLRRAFSRT